MQDGTNRKCLFVWSSQDDILAESGGKQQCPVLKSYPLKSATNAAATKAAKSGSAKGGSSSKVAAALNKVSLSRSLWSD